MAFSHSIPPEIIDRILAAAKIEDVIGEYVPLKRRGANLIGLCPFHNEKTGSFTVSPAKRIFKCFGCGKAGDVVRFVMEKEGITYPEALRFLANKYHIEIPEREMTDDEKQRQSDRESMLIVNNFANQWFQDQLWNSAEGKAIGQSYLRERGIHEDIARKFQLGYAPEHATLGQTCQKHGFQTKYLTNDSESEQIIGTGLCYEDKDGKLRDRFYGRLIFPFFSVSGRVTGFSGRLLKKNDKAAKYVNSPTSIIYEKHNELYGLRQALSAITKEQMCYLVEGQVDVIQMVQSGIENVVASGGTSLTKDQIRLLHRYIDKITIVYDGDWAGIKAALRGIDMVIEEGVSVYVILLPEGEDPDSFARKHNADELKTFLQKKAQDFIQFKIDLLSRDAEDDPIKQTEVIQSIAESVAKMKDVVKREMYIRASAKHLALEENIFKQKVYELIGKATTDAARSTGSKPSTPPSEQPSHKQEPKNTTDNSIANLMRILVRYGEKPFTTDKNTGQTVQVGEFICNELEADEVEPTNPLYRQMMEQYKTNCHTPGFVSSVYFSHHEDTELSQLAVDMIIDKYQLSRIYERKASSHDITMNSSEPKEEDLLAEIVPRLLLELKYTIVEDKINTLQTDLIKAQDTDDPNTMQAIAAQIPALIRYRQRLCQALGNRVIIR